jgi:hypothetical protein
VPVVAEGQAIEGEGLKDVLLHPVAEAGIDALPTGDPGGKVLLGLGQVAPVIKPPKLLQTVVVCLAGHVVKGVSEEVHIAPLPGRLRENLHDASAQSLMIVRNHELHPVKAAVPKGKKEVPPAGLTFPAGKLHSQDLPVSLLVYANGDKPGVRSHRRRADMRPLSVEGTVRWAKS